MNTGKLFFQKKLIAAALIYFLLSGFLLYSFGIQLGGEAEKYIDNAHRILQQGELRNGVFGIFYFSYSLIIAVFIKLSVNLVLVAVLQVILSFIAAICIYRLVLSAFGMNKLAFLFLCLYLLCYPIQKWNFYLYSESFHTSFLVIGSCLFIKALQEKGYRVWAAFMLAAIIIFFSRPVGVLFLITVTIVLINWFYRNDKRIRAYLLALACVSGIVGIGFSPLAAFVNPDSLKRMEVICQVPETNARGNYQEFNRAGLYKAFLVIRDEVGVGNFLKTGFKKLATFFGMYRKYYSWQNNLLLLLYCIFYPLALVGIFTKQPASFYYTRLLAIIYLILTCVAVFFTCDDWANRFISPAFPFILLLAASGCNTVYRALKKQGNKPSGIS